MANPYRSSVTIDGTKFDAVASQVVFTTAKDRSGMPEMGSLKTYIRVWADFHDDKNLPFSTLQKFFDMANVVTRDKVKEMKIEFWKDDKHEDALCSYKFKGWISNFVTTNPPVELNGALPSLNHLIIMDLEPVLNQENFQEITISN